MATLKNINPLGEIDLPLIGRSLAAGEEFDVSDEQAAILLMQDANYEAVKTTKPKAATAADTAQEG
jgi:hypothetical protein